jgi:hypothetical protein
LLLTEAKPVVELQLHTAEVEFAPNTQRNAAPVADEILLKGKAMTGLIDHAFQHWYQQQPCFPL